VRNWQLLFTFFVSLLQVLYLTESKVKMKGKKSWKDRQVVNKKTQTLAELFQAAV
jgi:hypothetical protein